MANIRKSFNFRTGLQVDNDNFVVNANGLVGIGTSIPQGYLLNVHGDTRVTGLVTTGELYAGIGTVGVLSATSADVSGILSVAQIKVGSSSVISNLVGYGYTAWITNDGGVGLHTLSRVGIGTGATPTEQLKVFGDVAITTSLTVGSATTIASYGINAPSGIITASSFDGNLNATDLTSGTISNSRLPATISVTNVTATTFTGSLTGTATTASSLTGSPNITVTDVSASNVSSGVVTATTELNVGSGGTALSALSTGRLGIGTALPTSEIQVRKASGSLVEVVSDSGEARISIGNSVGAGNSSALLRFGNSDGVLDIVNNDVGDVNTILHGGTGTGSTGNFKWIYGQTNAEMMTLTYDGKLGIGKTNPDTNLHVVGTSTVTGNAWFGGNVTITGTLNAGTFSLPSILSDTNLNVTTGVSTFFSVNLINDLLVDSQIGIGSTNSNPTVDLDAQGKDALFGTVGINTISARSALDVNGTLLVNAIGIGSTSATGLGYQAISIYDRTVGIEDTAITILNTSLVLDNKVLIGIGTTVARSALDFADAGKGYSTQPFLIPPRLTNAERAGLSTVAGAFIFNTDTSKFQGYTGIAWTDFH